jgi:hypothetical protein
MPNVSYVHVGPSSTGISGFCPKCNTCTWTTSPDGTSRILGCACNLANQQIVTNPPYYYPGLTITPTPLTPTDEAAKALQKAFDESAEEEAKEDELSVLRLKVKDLEMRLSKIETRRFKKKAKKRLKKHADKLGKKRSVLLKG